MFPPGCPVIGDEALSTIEAGADRVLAETGIRFEDDPETLDLWRQNGARVAENRVYLDGASLRETIRRHAPRRVTLRARNPARDVTIGEGEGAVFAPVYGPPNVLLADGTRVPGKFEHYETFVRMAHDAPSLGNTGHMICVPNDIAEPSRPLEMALAHLRLSDKPFMGPIMTPLGAEQVIDAVTLAYDRVPEPGSCDLLHLINSTPPLVYKENPLKALRTIARRKQGLMITSYMMLGATAPVTAAGALIQGYAEVLAGLALAQLWSPGVPVVMGLYGIPFSMRSMLPVFGDPVSHLIQMYSVRLARRLGVPVRGDGGITSSKTDDAQSGYESCNATAAAVFADADFVLHSAGWLEMGRCVSVSKFELETRMIAERYLRDPRPGEAPMPLAAAVEKELRGRIPR